jgi:hypothetical protein
MLIAGQITRGELGFEFPQKVDFKAVYSGVLISSHKTVPALKATTLIGKFPCTVVSRPHMSIQGRHPLKTRSPGVREKPRRMRSGAI